MVFSEDSRVKIPCILHLVRLGYRYLSLKDAVWDIDTNIFPALFNQAITRINPDLSADDVARLLADVKLLLDNEDLGNAFYDRLTERSGIRLIDFENIDNNSFHVVTELTCKKWRRRVSPRYHPAYQRHAAGLHRGEETQQP